VISVAFSRPFAGDWTELLSAGQSLVDNDEFEQRAEGLCRGVAERLKPALDGYRDRFLTEDYLVYAIYELEHAVSGDLLIAEHGGDIAAMLRGERQVLSDQEKTTILRHRLSYLADDLVVPTWNAALVLRDLRGSFVPS